MNVKIIAILAVELLCCGSTFCQAVPGPSSSQSEAERVVATLLADNGQVPIQGFAETLVSRLGDGAAVGLIQYIGDRKPTVSDDNISLNEVRRMLLIVRMSFEVPKIIEADEDRSPKATLVLLKYLSSLSAAKTLQDDLHTTSKLVERLKGGPAPSK